MVSERGYFDCALAYVADKVVLLNIYSEVCYFPTGDIIASYTFSDVSIEDYALPFVFLIGVKIRIDGFLSDVSYDFLYGTDKDSFLRSLVERKFSGCPFKNEMISNKEKCYSKLGSYDYNVLLSIRHNERIFCHYRHQFLHHSRAVDAQSKFYGTYRYFGYDNFIEYSR